jgi:DNA (cytosine-5)-methyltransferase 1
MSWHFSQALVAAYSAANCSDGRPSVALSGSPTPQAFLSPDRMKAFSRLSQDISCAGKGAGIDGERSGMWHHMARIVCDIRPLHVFVENSPMLTKRGLHRVLGDLAAMGYDARWGVLGAVDAGAPHKRDRIWIVAHAHGLRELQSKGHESDERGWVVNGGADLADADSAQRKGDERPERVAAEHSDISSAGWWESEPNVGRVADGVAARVDRLKAIGNGQVPAVAALAWRILSQ